MLSSVLALAEEPLIEFFKSIDDYRSIVSFVLQRKPFRCKTIIVSTQYSQRLAEGWVADVGD
jgi:hypothetical protein